LGGRVAPTQLPPPIKGGRGKSPAYDVKYTPMGASIPCGIWQAVDDALVKGKKMDTSTKAGTPLHPDDLFNGYVGANVAYAFQQIGLFSLLTPARRLSPAEIATHLAGDLARVKALLKAGHALGYIEQHEDGTVSVTEMGEILRGQLGYFTWCIGGYGEFFRQLSSLTAGNKAWHHLRNEGMVALGADMNNRSFMQHILFEVLDELDFTTIADLGCGNGGRLVTLCQRYPHIKGIGIDISADAIRLADANVRRHSLEDRLQMVCTDVLAAIHTNAYQDLLAHVEIMSCFMMLHDLYTIPDTWEVLFDRLRASFPHIKYFLIADTVRMPPVEAGEKLPIFSVGYELLHTYMDVNLPVKREYDEAFCRAGLTIKKCCAFGTPNTYLYLLQV